MPGVSCIDIISILRTITIDRLSIDAIYRPIFVVNRKNQNRNLFIVANYFEFFTLLKNPDSLSNTFNNQLYFQPI